MQDRSFLPAPVEARGRASSAGAGLLGLLVLLVVLGALVAVALAALDGDDGGSGGLGSVAPGGPAPVAGAAGPGGPAGLAGAATRAACAEDVRTLESAMAADHATRGSYPATLEELRAHGFVSELPARPGVAFAPEVVDGRPTGRILVNGLPAAEGCKQDR